MPHSRRILKRHGARSRAHAFSIGEQMANFIRRRDRLCQSEAAPEDCDLALIRIGPAGWSYKDWAGIVYTNPRPRGFSPVEYLSGMFDTIEINTSFYAPPRPEVTRRWPDQVKKNPKFRFTAKLWRGFTHERNATAEDEKLSKAGMDPLINAERLGAVLMQFPMSFQNTPEHRH